MLLSATNPNVTARGLWNGFKALPVALWHGSKAIVLDVWRVRPRHAHGNYHVSYIVGMVIFIVLTYVLINPGARRRLPFF